MVNCPWRLAEAKLQFRLQQMLCTYICLFSPPSSVMQVMYSEGHGTTHNSAYPNRLGEIVQDLKDFGQQGDLPQEFQLNQHLVPCTELQME